MRVCVRLCMCMALLHGAHIKVCCLYACACVHDGRSLRALSLSINFKWAESNQCSQQDPALALPPLPLSHLNFSPPPRSAPRRAGRWFKNQLVDTDSRGLK